MTHLIAISKYPWLALCVYTRVGAVSVQDWVRVRRGIGGGGVGVLTRPQLRRGVKGAFVLSSYARRQEREEYKQGHR